MAVTDYTLAQSLTDHYDDTGTLVPGLLHLTSGSLSMASGLAAFGQAAPSGGATVDITATDVAKYATRFLSAGNLLSLQQTTDWAGVHSAESNVQYDSIDMWHRSQGDAIYIVHTGGLKPGGVDTGGGKSGINIIIPYYRDNFPLVANGYTGTVQNTYTLMDGVQIQALATSSYRGISLSYRGSDAGIVIANGDAFGDGHPVGNGQAIRISNASTAEVIHIDQASTGNVVSIVTTANARSLSLTGNSTSETIFLQRTDATTTTLAYVHSVSGDTNPRLSLRYDGLVSWGPGNAATDALITRLGVNELSTSPIRANPATTANNAFGILVGAESQRRFQIIGDGTMSWGSGSAARDTFLARVAGTPGGVLSTASTFTNTGGVTDGYLGALRMTPTYDGAFTVTRHNYLDFNNPLLTNSAVLTDAAVLRFDAAPGTHKALAANASVAVSLTSVGPTGAQTTVQGWLKLNVNGTLRYVPFW